VLNEPRQRRDVRVPRQGRLIAVAGGARTDRELLGALGVPGGGSGDRRLVRLRLEQTDQLVWSLLSDANVEILCNTEQADVQRIDPGTHARRVTARQQRGVSRDGRGIQPRAAAGIELSNLLRHASVCRGKLRVLSRQGRPVVHSNRSQDSVQVADHCRKARLEGAKLHGRLGARWKHRLAGGCRGG